MGLKGSESWHSGLGSYYGMKRWDWECWGNGTMGQWRRILTIMAVLEDSSRRVVTYLGLKKKKKEKI